MLTSKMKLTLKLNFDIATSWNLIFLFKTELFFVNAEFLLFFFHGKHALFFFELFCLKKILFSVNAKEFQYRFVLWKPIAALPLK